MAFIHGTVIDPSSAGTQDGTSAPVNMGRANDVLVSELHGKYFQQCYRGNVYYGSTATTGVVIPIASTLTPTFAIWNPAGSGKLCVPIVTLITWTATQSAVGGYCWMSTRGGDVISTIGAFTAYNTSAPISANLGSGKASQMRMSVSTASATTLVAAAVFYRSTGIGAGVNTVATVGFWTMREDWDGSGVVPPGMAIMLMGTTAIATTATITLAWEEIPL